MQKVASKVGFTESWHDVKKMVTTVIQRYPHYGADDREEMQGEANLAFCEAYHTWEEGRGKFTTHVFNRARFAMLNHRSKEARRVSHEVPIDLLEGFDPEDHRGPGREGKTLEEALVGLGEDSLFLVNLARRLPEMLKGQGVLKQVSVKKIREYLINYLEAAGWDEDRILRAWSGAVKAFA